MEINKLTIGEAKKKLEEHKTAYEELSSLFGKEVCLQQSAKSKFIGKYVIVRTYSAGVFAGTLVSKNKQEGIMKNTRRLWYWDGAASLSELAMKGVAKPNKCKFPCEVPEIELNRIIEVIPCTKEAEDSIKKVEEWTKNE